MAKTKRKPSAAFMKPVTPSANLGAVIGNKAMPRTEVTKKIWQYIKRHKLQDKKNRRMINADEALKAVFGGKKQVNMFEMTKLVSRQLKLFVSQSIDTGRLSRRLWRVRNGVAHHGSGVRHRFCSGGVGFRHGARQAGTAAGLFQQGRFSRRLPRVPGVA